MKRLGVASFMILLSCAAQAQNQPEPLSAEATMRLSEFFRFADVYCASTSPSAPPSPQQSKCIHSATGKWTQFADHYCAIKLAHQALSPQQLRCLHDATTELLQMQATAKAKIRETSKQREAREFLVRRKIDESFIA